jgi:hypothetical protein
MEMVTGDLLLPDLPPADPLVQTVRLPAALRLQHGHQTAADFPDRTGHPLWNRVVPVVTKVTMVVETEAAVALAVVETEATVALAAVEAEAVVVVAEEDNLLTRYIRCTHIPQAHIFAISFFKQAHIIPRINGVIG